VEEVLNYIGAMHHGLARLSELPVSVRLIRETHEKLLAGARGSLKWIDGEPHEVRIVDYH
jgi:Fic family protein